MEPSTPENNFMQNTNEDIEATAEESAAADASEAVCEEIPTEPQTDAPADRSTAERKRLPLFSKILLGIAVACIPLYALFIIFPSFSDFFNRYISSAFRALTATLTGWIPFSLAEFLIILIPVILVLIVGIGIKRYSSSWRNVGVFCLIMLSIGSYVFSSFVIGFVPAYRGSSLDQKLGLDKQPVSAEELYDTALILAQNVDENIKSVSFEPSGASVMPYSYEEMEDKLLAAYDKACEKYDFLQKLHSNVKRVMLSEPMTYTHISGVYTFFTGEANININFPQYTIPYTAAHELAHQRGIAREDEANFVAFLVCMESDDAYIRYSGYMNLYEYVLSALASASDKYYAEAYFAISYEARKEMAAYSVFFKKYQDNIVGEVSGAVNETFIEINGSLSYGMVVDLAVAYYKQDSPVSAD